MATEGSADAEFATTAAVGLAKTTGSEHYEPTDVEPASLEREARRILVEQVRKIETLGGTIPGSHLRMGGVAEEVVKLAEDLGGGLVAVGSRGKGRIRGSPREASPTPWSGTPAAP